MIFKVTLLMCVIYSTFGKNVKITNDEEHPLEWPRKYSIEARKYYMTSGFLENFKYWRSGRSSRLESNDGAVIKITKGKRMTGGTKYEIHPQTTENEYNKIVCIKKEQSFVGADDFLPKLTDLKREGNDHVKGVNCVKFTNAEESDKVYEKTLWAYYTNSSTEGWIPVRYKSKKIDEWHGYLNDHVIWDFFNFISDVDVDVFTVKYNCTTAKDDDDILHKKSNANIKHSKVVASHQALSLKHRASRSVKDIKMDRHQKNKPMETDTIPFPYMKWQLKKIAESLPKEYDLRLEGLVGPVLNKEDCESSWAIAATATMEGALARANTGSWMKLSERALLDCSWGFGNKGCKGGTDRDAYEWIKKYGLPTEQDYGRYANNHGFCKIKNMTTYKIKGITNVTPFSVDSLKIALVNHGPVSVTVDSTVDLLYEGGIFYNEHCKSSPNDSITMTVVGYGEQDGDTFWILKNARGPYWGTDGYIHISSRDNNCGVMTQPVYVVV